MLQESVQLVSQSAILSLALFPRSVGKLTNSEEEVQVAKDGNRTLQINVSLKDDNFGSFYWTVTEEETDSDWKQTAV